MRFLALSFGVILGSLTPSLYAEPLPGTKPLTAEGDLSTQMVEGIDKYLMRATADSVKHRQQYWKPDFSSPENYAKSVQPNRDRLKKIIGVVEERLPPRMEHVATTDTPALVAETDRYKIYAVRWPVFEGVDGEGLLLEPKHKVSRDFVANIIAIPDADWTPEQLVGLAPGVPKESQFARRLAENGCRVVVPVLIDRQDTWSGNPKIRMTNQPHREFIYRMAFEMGRHIIGYEVQKVLAAVDWYWEKDHVPIGVVGYGEGAHLALLSSAIDERIKATAILGHFGPREGIWEEPIYRNTWGLLTEFGDGELIHLCFPRSLHIEHSSFSVPSGPGVRQGRQGAAPGKYIEHTFPQRAYELNRVLPTFPDKSKFSQRPISIFAPVVGSKGPGTEKVLGDFNGGAILTNADAPTDLRKTFDPAPRQKRQFGQLVQYNQKLLRDSEGVRQQFFWSKLRGLTPPARLEEYEASIEPFRKYLHEEVIGKLPDPTMPPNPRTRQVFDEPKWKGYEVLLDCYPDVYAYGILCVPKDLKPGEKRPVVVCQHGLEGRPQDVVNPKMKTRAYNSYGSQLADLGYIVYAPQNPYIGKDFFRQVQRKANPLKLSLFSFIIRQHERTLDWLETLPYVDKEKIALYGLSYGGKTAMRVPAIERRYCLSICSGDFNEWIEKMVSIDRRVSYMFTGEYEMFEFDLGHTFNYAEMAALIAPRPFMVERGHDDGVGIDEMVAYEYAKVRRLYGRLKLPERTELEFFAGGHEIHAVGTYAFLKKHLGWPK